MLDEKQKFGLFEALRTLSILKVGNISEDRLRAYVEVLSVYPVANLRVAIELCTKEIKFFPDISEILNYVNPKLSADDASQLMCDNIINTVLKYGRYEQHKTKELLTHDENNALTNIGGCFVILDSMLSDMPIIRSQIRKSCKAVISWNKQKENIGKIENFENVKALQ